MLRVLLRLVSIALLAAGIAMNSIEVSAATSTTSTSAPSIQEVQRWSISTGAKLPAFPYFSGSMFVGKDGTIYLVDDTRDEYGSQPSGNESTQILAINPSHGHIKWKLDLKYPCHVRPVVGRDGTIYILTAASGRGFQGVAGTSVLYAVSPTGSQKWSISFNEENGTALALGGNQTLYVGLTNWWVNGSQSVNGTVSAVTTAGKPLWNATLRPGDGVYSIAAAENGFIYVIGAEQSAIPSSVYGLAANGRQNWLRSGLAYVSPGIVGRDGNFYCGVLENLVTGTMGRVVAIDEKNGSTLWQAGSYSATPTVVAQQNGTLICTDQGVIFALNRLRHMVWKHTIPAQVPTPVVTSNGLIEMYESIPYDYNGPNRLDHSPTADILSIRADSGKVISDLLLPNLSNVVYTADTHGNLYVENRDRNELYGYQAQTVPASQRKSIPPAEAALLNSIWSVSIHAKELVTHVGQPVQLIVKAYTKAGSPVSVPARFIHYLIWNRADGNSKTATVNSKGQFTAKVGGVYDMDAVINNVAPVLPAEVTVIADPAYMAVASKPTLVATPADVEPITVKVTDKFGRAVPDVPVTFTTNAPSQASLRSPIAKTNNVGQATAMMVGGSKTGVSQVTATTGKISVTTSVYTVPQPSQLTITTDTTSYTMNVQGDSSAQPFMYAVATNKDGTPAAGIAVHLTMNNHVFGVPDVAYTGDSGKAWIPIYVGSTTPGSETITATVGTVHTQIVLTLNAGFSPNMSSVTLPSTISLANLFPVYTTLKDASGNPVVDLSTPAFNLKFTNTSHTYNLEAWQGSVDANGNYSEEFSARNRPLQPGTYSVSLYVNGLLVGAPQQVKVTL